MSIDLLMSYWSMPVVQTNLIIILNLVGALFLGSLLGAERSYHGRAAGMRTFSLVCMASCALTVFTGYSHFWWGGHLSAGLYPDPTRVIQGIVSGIGFLGAGVIMRDGFTISGLSTAASIWMCSAIGILIGVGFYGAAIALTLLAIGSMLFFSRFEQIIPQKQAIVVHLTFKDKYVPNEAAIREKTLSKGYSIGVNAISILFREGKQEWSFVAISIPGKHSATISEISTALINSVGIDSFSVSHSRN